MQKLVTVKREWKYVFFDFLTYLNCYLKKPLMKIDAARGIALSKTPTPEEFFGYAAATFFVRANLWEDGGMFFIQVYE